MGRLLYIESSPRKKRSASIDVAHTFIEAYEAANPSHEVQVLDLWSIDLLRIDGDAIDAKYAIMHGQSQTEAQRKAWRLVEQLIAQFKQADCYLFSLPMWNFSIPYQLKHYIDLIVQPTYTFSFTSEKGYEGLVSGKPAVLIYARGGEYSSSAEAQALDMQKSYMETILRFIGFNDFHSILIEPTMGGDKEAITAKAKDLAKELAGKMALSHTISR